MPPPDPYCAAALPPADAAAGYADLLAVLHDAIHAGTPTPDVVATADVDPARRRLLDTLLALAAYS